MGVEVLTGTDTEFCAEEEDNTFLLLEVSCGMIGLSEDSAEEVSCVWGEQDTASTVTSMIKKRHKKSLYFMRR